MTPEGRLRFVPDARTRSRSIASQWSILFYAVAGVAIAIAGLAVGPIWLAIVGGLILVYALGLIAWRTRGR
jgi:hypothetical protein